MKITSRVKESMMKYLEGEREREREYVCVYVEKKKSTNIKEKIVKTKKG